MSENKPQRQLEGPARLISGRHDERMLREEGRGIPMSYARYLTRTYGEEGVGWGFETDTTHAQENETNRVLHGVEFALAKEAMDNFLFRGSYELNDGSDMTGKVQRRPRNPDMGNIVVYPDGDQYKQHIDVNHK